MVRTMTGFRFPNWLRVTLVKEPVMHEFLSAFREVVELVRPDGDA